MYIRNSIEEANLIREEHRILHFNKLQFGSNIMRFDPLGYLWQEYHTEVAFVYNEDEATGFPQHVMVMWPSHISPWILIEINNVVRIDNIDTTVFGLSYPITMRNVVDDWDKVFAMYIRFRNVHSFAIPYRARQNRLNANND